MSQTSEEECVFCFEELSKYDKAILNCPHQYHLHCIQKWNKTSKNFTKVCPQCNVAGEIVNITKGEQSPPISPQNTISNNSFINNQQHTYYDERLNTREVPLIDQNNNVILPRRRLEEEYDHNIICCTIL